MPRPEDVDAWLVDIPQLAWWLPRVAIARPPQDAGGGGGSKPGSRVPIKLDVTLLLDRRLHLDTITNPAWCDPENVGIVPYLYGWTRDIAFELADAGLASAMPKRPAIGNLCRWLRYHLRYATRLTQWPELAWGIGYVRANVDAVTRHVRDDAPRHLVTCGQCHQGHLHPLSDREWRCDNCDRYIKITATTLPEAARIADWPARTLRHWIQNEPERFARVEVDGIRYFDLGQILARIAEAKLNATLRTTST